LRDWPKMRMSSKNTEAFQPGSKTCTLKEFLHGEWDMEITHIFGEELMNSNFILFDIRNEGNHCKAYGREGTKSKWAKKQIN
jgi:hypothetical protein